MWMMLTPPPLVSISAEITLMKENISQLLADVTLLKRSVAKTQESLDAINKTMKSKCSNCGIGILHADWSDL